MKATISSSLVACMLLLVLIAMPSGALASQSANWGTGVAVSPPANAASNPKVYVHQVSCPSAGNCTVAGGYYDSAGDYEGFLLSESGGMWGSAVEAVMPADAASNPGVGFGSLSCASAGNCTAVGDYTDSAGHSQGFLLSETSGMWGTGVEASAPANAASNPEVDLQSVSCPSAGECSAIGEYTDSSEIEHALLLSETSGTWGTGVEAIMPANVTAGAGGRLTGLSCSSAGNCVAVGHYAVGGSQYQGLLLSETSGTWGAGVEATPPANADWSLFLEGVSCASAGNCTAVGWYFDSEGHQGLLLSETSGVWGTGVEARMPANGGSEPDAGLNGVQCASAGNCTAGGNYIANSDQIEGVLLTDVSGVWGTGIEAPEPVNARSEPFFELGSLSCPSAGNCAVIGSYWDSSNDNDSSLLTESSGSWGPALEAQAPANAGANPEASLGSVSCTSPGNCTAVGEYTNGEGQKQSLLLTATPETADLSASGPLGGAFAGSPIAASAISAALAGGSAPSGTIAFTVFGPQPSPPSSCTSGGTTVGAASASGDGTYQPSAGFTPPSPGKYWWYASYGGDVGDEPSTSMCGAGMAETTVASKAIPTLSVSGPLGGVAGSPIPASSVSATLAGGSAPTGTITFTVFGPQSSPPSSCAGGTAVGTASVNGNGTYQPSAGFTPPSAGEYWWYASYGGDAGDEPAASACGALMAQTLVAAAPTTPSSSGTESSGSGSGAVSGTGVKAPASTLSGVELGSTRFTAKKGIALKLTLSQSATIKIVITQTVKGHKLGGVCKATVKQGKSCTTTVEKRTLRFSGAAGSNTFELKTAGLGKGSYTATITAGDANGSSSPVRLTFTITNK